MTEVDRETWDEIQREMAEGTPDTPERLKIFEMADQIYRRHTRPKKRRWYEYRVPPFSWFMLGLSLGVIVGTLLEMWGAP